jgi:hypothetical protein
LRRSEFLHVVVARSLNSVHDWATEIWTTFGEQVDAICD